MYDKEISFHLSWDEESDAGYLRPRREDEGGVRTKTIPIQDKELRLYGAIDLAEDGTLLGIEILGVSKILRSQISND